MSDYVSLKMCMLKLSDGKVDAAVKHFLKHISWYKELFLQHGHPETPGGTALPSVESSSNASEIAYISAG